MQFLSAALAAILSFNGMQAFAVGGVKGSPVHISLLEGLQQCGVRMDQELQANLCPPTFRGREGVVVFNPTPIKQAFSLQPRLYELFSGNLSASQNNLIGSHRPRFWGKIPNVAEPNGFGRHIVFKSVGGHPSCCVRSGSLTTILPSKRQSPSGDFSSVVSIMKPLEAVPGEEHIGPELSFAGFSGVGQRLSRYEPEQDSGSKQSGSETRNGVCPEFLPKPLIAFGIAAAMLTGGLYIEGRGWSRAGPLLSLAGLLGWFSLLLDDWWSPLICIL